MMEKCVLAQNMDIVKKRIEFITHAVQSIKSIKPVVIYLIISPPNKFTLDSWEYSPCMWIVKCH